MKVLHQKSIEKIAENRRRDQTEKSEKTKEEFEDSKLFHETFNLISGTEVVDTLKKMVAELIENMREK